MYKKYLERRLRKFARRRCKISKIYAKIIEKIERGEELGAHKFRLFNANDKKKYIPKRLAKQTTKRENLSLGTISIRISRGR